MYACAYVHTAIPTFVHNFTIVLLKKSVYLITEMQRPSDVIPQSSTFHTQNF